MATSYTEGQYPGEFLISEACGTRSRESGTLASGNNLKAGAVLGRIDMGSATSQAGTNTGNGAMGAITVGATAQAGAYTLRVIEAAVNAGKFQVLDPQGDVVGIGTVAVAFSGGGLSFTLADGATDFAVGDTFTITVAAGSGKYTELNPAAATGAEDAAGILWDSTDATSADAAMVVIARDAEVDAAQLQWPAGATTAQKNAALAQLKALGVIARS